VLRQRGKNTSEKPILTENRAPHPRRVFKVNTSTCYEGKWGVYRYNSTCAQLQYHIEVSGQPHTPAALPSGNGPSVPVQHKAGWTQQLIQTFWRRKQSLAPSRNRTLHCTSHSLLTIPTELPWLSRRMQS
jgi:hypothetical protein